MLDAVIRFSIRNKLIIGMLMLALIFWGSYSLTRLPIDAVPDITNNQVQIITSAPSQSAQDIERLITFPIEQSVATIPDMQEVRSFSRFGLSVVTVVFHDDLDIYKARQLVSERLLVAANDIPPGIGKPVLAPISTGLGEIYQYTVSAKPGFEKKYPAMELRTIQDWIVRRQLLGVEGVAEVSSMGGYVKQYEIALNSHKLNSLGISIADIFTALQKSNQNTGGAYIDKKPNAWYIRSEGLIGSLGDIENIVVKHLDNGIPVLIRDIAKVGYGNAIRYGALTRNENPEAVGAMVLMLKGANASQVIENVKERIDQINKTLPEGVEIKPFLDRTVLVNKAISTVVKNLLEGALIVIFVLVLFLGNFRAGLIVASVIPLAMLFAIALMNLFGVSGNLMSLGAIDFGLIVDGAVIIVEATLHHMSQLKKKKLTQPEMDAEVYNSASKIRSSAAFGEIIILIVYLPILALVGIEGKMFKPMAQTVSFAILGAFILSLTYVPMMSALFLSKKTEHKRNLSDRLIDGIHRIYEPVIKKSLKIPRLLVGSAVLLFIAVLFLFSRLGAEFLPSLDEGDFSIETRVLSGSSLQETIDASVKASKILRTRFPDEVASVVGKIGSAEIPTDPMPIEACDLIVTLKDKSLWTRAETKNELADQMTKELEDIPGVTFGFQQPIQMRFNELMTGARQDVVVKVYGENLDELTGYSKKIAGIINTIDGAADLYLENVKGARQILISYDRDAIARFGLTIEDINTTVNAAFAGQSAGLVYEGEKRFDMVVRLEKKLRSGIEDVKNLYVKTADGNQIPLSQVASVRFDDTAPIQIQRDDAKRRITVGFNVRGRDVESVVKELQRKIGQEVKFAPGYYPTYGGTFENLQEASGRLSIAVPVALLLIFILLYFTFSSLRQSLLIFSAIPLSAIGGVFALWLRDMPFSISAGVGFIALFGVAVLNGIVLIGEFNHLKKEGMEDVGERILKATHTRLRPVVMTAAVASLGFLPMALSHGSGAEVQKPLATVVIGGLVTATLLTLVILPCIYYLTNRPKMMNKKPNNAPKAVGVLLISLLLQQFSFGQTIYSLDSALQTAYSNNKSMQSKSQQVTYYSQLKKTGSELPKTDVNLMVGQYNSYYHGDNNVTISQTIPFPTVFVAKSHLAQAQIAGAEKAVAVSKNELTFEIRQLYEQSSYWNAYKNGLLKQDSLIQRFAKATEANYKAGQGTLLEKTTIEVRLNEIRSKQAQVDAELNGIARRLQFLLGINHPVQFVKADLVPIAVIARTDTAMLKANPQAEYLQQQIEIAEYERKLVNSAALPDLKVGYFNQTLYGTQLAEGSTQLAGRSDRFQGFQVGLTIPLWFGPDVNKSKASKINREMKNLEYENYVSSLQSEYEKTLLKLQSNRNSMEYYVNSALKNADLIEAQSVKSFELGEIDFTTHLLHVQQTITIREGYLNAVHEYNANLLYLNYLMAE